MNKMLTHLNGYQREAVLAPLFKMLEATFDLFVPLVMADIVNVGIAAHDLHYILVRCGILLLLAMVGLACSLTAQYFCSQGGGGLLHLAAPQPVRAYPEAWLHRDGYPRRQHPHHPHDQRYQSGAERP